MRNRPNAHYMCPDYKLGTSVNGLVRLDYLGIPFPTRSPFNPFSVRNVAGNKLTVGDGFPHCIWEFSPALTRGQWQSLLSFIGTGVASAYVYIRTTNNDTSSFANYYAVMNLPDLTPVGYHVGAFEEVRVPFTGLVLQ